MNNLTKDKIIALAREAGFIIGRSVTTGEPNSPERFATLCRAPLVAEVERLKQAHEINADTLNAMQVEIDDWKARALKSEQAGESTPNDVVAGALYDFLGYLTSRRTRVTMSDRDEAGPAVDALVDWSKTRKITLEEARVEDWQNYTTPPQPAAQEPTSAVPVVEPVAWSHGCNALCANIDLWISSCPHCGKPRPAAPVPQEQTSAVPVVEQLVEALKDAQRSFSPAIHVGVSSAIAAGQQYLKEIGK